MNDPVTFAILGTGHVAHYHAKGIRAQSGRAKLVAACDVNENALRQFAGQYDVPQTFTSLDAMLKAARPAIVCVCTPPSLHCDQSEQILRGGSWVLCEKPMVASLAEHDRIEAAERETGRYCASIFQFRFASVANHYRRLITSGALGRPLVATCNTTWFRGPDYYDVEWRGKWATELGGPTVIHGIHAMDTLLSFFGDWHDVFARCATLQRSVQTEDTSMAIVRFKNGAMATIINSVLCPKQECYLRFDFENATLESKYLYEHKVFNWLLTPQARFEHDPQVARWLPSGADIGSSHAAQISAVIDAYLRGQAPPVSAAEARRTTEFISAIYKSAATNSPVSRGHITPADPFYQHMGGSFHTGQPVPRNV